MAIPIDKILGFSGNKYEITVAMIKYSRYLSQKNDESLEVPMSRGTKGKITSVAMNDILTGKVAYTFDKPADEK